MKSSPPLIIMSEEQKERRYLGDLGISFVGHLPMNEWPKHLFKTFQQIRAVRSYDLTTFCSSAVTKLKLGIAWDCETGNRARTIAATCRALVKDDVSEMEWRLRIEELFLTRFRSEIECPQPSCKKRVWRSEIEAIVESPGIIAASLENRRKDREPCRCQNEPGSSNLSRIDINKMFSSRSDEMVLYNPFEKAPKKSSKTFPRRRRPDRIVGFQENGSLDRRLDSIARLLQDTLVTNTIRETTECTILNSKSGQLLFPFLVIEAKSESGEGFNVCGRQTALPIWKMLKIQEELQSRSERNLEYGGPLVWYIAYRGEAWRLYGCYTVKEKGKVCYEILELWSGLLSDDNEALQVLLMIDYIFDWARDIYRASIISQLEALAEKPHAGLENGPSRMPTDSDIFSLSGRQQKLASDIDNWIANTWDHMESPQDIFSSRNLCGSVSNINVWNPELIHGEISIPSSSDSKPATPSSSEHLGQEPINEYKIDRADSSSTESLDSDMGEDEAAELRAAITDSFFTLYQKLPAQDPPIAPPVTDLTAAESPLSEDSANAELGSSPPITRRTSSSRDSNPKAAHSSHPPEQPTPTITIRNANPSPHPPSLNNNRTNKTHTLPLYTPARYPRKPPQASPSPGPNRTPPLTPSRASAPSPEQSVPAAGSSPKRPLDLEGEDMVEISGLGTRARNGSSGRVKRVKPAFAGAPPGVDVVVID